MDPDVMVTVAFVIYAVLVAVGAGVGIVIARRHRDANMDDGAAQPGERSSAVTPVRGAPRGATTARRLGCDLIRPTPCRVA
jgi:hypothetical protein